MKKTRTDALYSLSDGTDGMVEGMNKIHVKNAFQLSVKLGSVFFRSSQWPIDPPSMNQQTKHLFVHEISSLDANLEKI